MVFVITGGPGFGKSTLISALSQMGFVVGNEVARDIIDEQQKMKGDILPWKDIAGFEKKVAEKRIEFLKNVPANVVAFSDRGLPDQIGFSWCKKKIESAFLKEMVVKYKYAKLVFVTPPWEDIYSTDQIRTESFQEASKIHSYIVDAYYSYGYDVVDLPLVAPDKRVEFIQNKINNLKL